MKWVLVGIVLALLAPFVLGVQYTSVSQCDQAASNNQYINAGLCYQYFDVWDKCSYYLLKGARQAELKWDYNMNNYDDYSTAVNYYGGLTQSCLKNWGKRDLADQVLIYHNWIQKWLVNKDQPPFNMDTFIAGIHDQIWPPSEGVISGNENKTGNAGMNKSTSGNTNAGAGNQTPGAKQSNTSTSGIDLGLVIVGIGVVVAVIILFVLFMLKTSHVRKEEPKEKE